jgi:hypothetical protein
VRIEITEARTLQRHKDRYGTGRDICIRNIEVDVWIWNYHIKSLTRLAFIKSVLQSFLYNRMGNIVGKDFVMDCLHFQKTQQHGKQYLKFELYGTDGSIDEEEYFDYREVVMLDIALGKALNFLSP